MNKIDEIAEYAATHDFAEEMEQGTWETDVVEDPMISTSIRLPKSLMDRVRQAADDDGVKPTAWIRQLVERKFSEKEAATADRTDLEARVSHLEAAIADIRNIPAQESSRSNRSAAAVRPLRRAGTQRHGATRGMVTTTRAAAAAAATRLPTAKGNKSLAVKGISIVKHNVKKK
ncbi:hypothetical protein [Amycolatopsis jejuensis]|uniref:hypothetical protein n=1 Tax=Amycolatopsis jejuensis TaxID=330084 RepID=UPI0012E0A951|nr:hypothetical protein [Amycolatopsis jejuensis]